MVASVTTPNSTVSGPTGRMTERSVDPTCARSPLGTFGECPLCGGTMAPEHAHERCSSCGWRDSCCD